MTHSYRVHYFHIVWSIEKRIPWINPELQNRPYSYLIRNHKGKLFGKAKNFFDEVKEPFKGTQGKEKEISITDCLTSALGIFKLKYSSLLQFEEEKKKNRSLKT